MKMARASEEAIEAMLRLTGILGDVFEDGQFPRSAETGEFVEGDPDYFDEDDHGHLVALYRRLDPLLGRDSQHCGDLRRVVFGFAVLTDPANRLLNPEADALAWHPRFLRLITAAQRARDYLDGVSGLLDGAEPGSGCGDTLASLDAALAEFGDIAKQAAGTNGNDATDEGRAA